MQQLGMFDVVEDQERPRPLLERGSHPGGGQVEVFLLGLAERQSEIGRQPQQNDPQIGQPGRVYQEPPARIVVGEGL